MKRRFVGAMYHYEYSRELETELSRRGYHFIVKWDGFSPDGIQWLAREGKVPTKADIKREVADILGIDKGVIVSFAINMGVEETRDGEGYQQYVKSVTIISNELINQIDI